MTICSECDRPTVAKGLCDKHYRRLHRRGTLQLERHRIQPGERFGRLTVECDTGRRYSRSPTNTERILRCQCECGNVTELHAGDLRSGAQVSCGCLKRERFTRHGLLGHPLYGVWQGMRARCNRPKNASYRDYGARGIKVCARWDDFAAFLADMGKRPSPHHQIHRLDNDGNYEPSNCRWIERSDHARIHAGLRRPDGRFRAAADREDGSSCSSGQSARCADGSS